MNGWLWYTAADLCLVIALLLVRRCLWMPVRVDGKSMCSTLMGGEWLGASWISLKRRGVRRGDIVICHYPGRTWKHCKLIRLMFVKRVVGLPGETISIVDGVTYINGQPLEEPYLNEQFINRRRQMSERSIGPHEVFVMGDNRRISHDSRSIGPLDLDLLVGRVVCQLWPWKKRRIFH